MKKALAEIEDIGDNLVPLLGADDPHSFKDGTGGKIQRHIRALYTYMPSIILVK